MLYSLVIKKENVLKEIFYSICPKTVYPMHINFYIDIDVTQAAFYDPDIGEYLDYNYLGERNGVKNIYLYFEHLSKNKNKYIYIFPNEPGKSHWLPLPMTQSITDYEYTMDYEIKGIEDDITVTFTLWNLADNTPIDAVGDYGQLTTRLLIDEADMVDCTIPAVATGIEGIWQQTITPAELEYLDSVVTVTGEYGIYTNDAYITEPSIALIPTSLHLNRDLDDLIAEILDATWQDKAVQNTVRDALDVYFKTVLFSTEVVAGVKQNFYYQGVSIHTNFYESRGSSLIKN